MNLFRTTAALAVAAGLVFMPAHATQQNASGNTIYTADAPPAFAMAADLLIARPLLIAATVVGTGVFIIALPFSALGGNVGESADALIGEPGREAFARCLGCSTPKQPPAR
jgi:hypothetical protein